MFHVVLTLLSVLVWQTMGDQYMQCISGSNNRLDEANRDRNNGNRLFDSQNNNRGGYNVGKYTFYEGEEVPISWTNQHSAGLYQLKNNEFVIQYACDNLMRDGETTQTIPTNPTNCEMYDCDRDVEYGRHESYASYMYCRASSRNKGLFTANQNLRNRNGAIYTRQNPGGTRRGYECPEERDYYPYWRPSMWRDIAIYTNQIGRCAAYKAESQNKKERWSCMYADDYWTYILKGYVNNNRRGQLPLNQTDCEDLGTYTNPTNNQTEPMAKWVRTAPFDIPEPECLLTRVTRTNHHGTPGGRSYWTHTWTVPAGLTGYSCCVVRMRYNITTNDYPAWADDATLTPGVDYRNNSKDPSPNRDQDPAWILTWESFGLTYAEVAEEFDGNRNEDADAAAAGYIFVNNPRIDPHNRVFTTSNAQNVRVRLQLAINTNQFGRTFQDRTHCFEVKPNPNNLAMKLLTVQGKRGNIVQVYPATEYFFVPEPFRIRVMDYAHFCWTGSNTNPNNNDGQGKAGTDRSNICPLTQAQFDKSQYGEVDGNEAARVGGAVGDLGNNYPDYVQMPGYGIPDYVQYANKRGVTPSNMGGLDIDLLRKLCVGRDVGQNDLMDYGNMEELDDAGTSVCFEPAQVTTTGTWNFLCTRNNNFSNRSQKGTMTVSNSNTALVTVSAQGGAFGSTPGEARFVVQSNMVQGNDNLDIEATTWFNIYHDSTIVELRGAGGGALNTASLGDGGWVELWIAYTPRSLHSPKPLYTSDLSQEWQDHAFGATIEKYGNAFYGVTNVRAGGYYTIQNAPNVAEIIAIVIGGGAFILAITLVLLRKCTK